MPEGGVVRNVTENQRFFAVVREKDAGFIAWPCSNKGSFFVLDRPTEIVSPKRVRCMASTDGMPLGVVHLRKTAKYTEVTDFNAQTCFGHVAEGTYGLDESFGSVPCAGESHKGAPTVVARGSPGSC